MPVLKNKVTPKVVYPPSQKGLNSSMTKVIKVHSPFEYLHYIRKRMDFQEKQKELIEMLQVDE